MSSRQSSEEIMNCVIRSRFKEHHARRFLQQPGFALHCVTLLLPLRPAGDTFLQGKIRPYA
jgi:hypothetical protein